MHFLTYLLRPLAEPQADPGTAGAFANCWIEHPSREAAEKRARELIAAAFWRIESLQDYRVVGDGDYDGDTVGREYYERACTDHEVLVLHTWPVSGEGEA